MRFEWKCCECGEDAEYSSRAQKYCKKHWWVYISTPHPMTPDEVVQKQKDIEAWSRRLGYD